MQLRLCDRTCTVKGCWSPTENLQFIDSHIYVETAEGGWASVYVMRTPYHRVLGSWAQAAHGWAVDFESHERIKLTCAELGGLTRWLPGAGPKNAITATRVHRERWFATKAEAYGELWHLLGYLACMTDRQAKELARACAGQLL